jgi:hypothetical protein
MGSTLATSKLIKACLYIGTQLLPRVVAFLQKSKRLADNFAGGLIETAAANPIMLAFLRQKPL